MKELEHIAHSLHEVAMAIRGLGKVPKPSKTIRLAVTGLFILSKPRSKETGMINTSCRNTEFVRVALAPLDEDGVTEKLDGDPTASVKAGSGKATVKGLSVDIVPDDGFVGTLTVEIDADAAAGARVNVISETVTIDVVAPEVIPKDAVTLGATVTTLPKPAV